MRDAIVISTLGVSPDDLLRGELSASWIEWRADLGGDFEVPRVAAQRLYTLRGVRAGRTARLLGAARSFDLVDLEPCDLTAEILGAIPPHRRVITWRGRAASLGELKRALASITRVEARLYRIETEASSCSEAILPLELLRATKRSDVTACALGAIGLWTRIVAPFLGAPVVAGGAGIDGMPSVEQLFEDYGFPDLPRVEELFGIVGNPVLRSLSPRLHNAGFRMLGRAALYVPFHAESFADFWQELIASGRLEGLGFGVGALCVVSPHKEIAIDAAESRTPIVARARSTNFFTNRGGTWTAGSTDPDGVLLTLRERGIDARNQRAAVVGCGGSGRAIAAALSQAGAEVTLVNRGFDRGALAVGLLHLPFEPLAGFSPRGYSIVVNATPVGHEAGELPFNADTLSDDAVVIDLVYGREPTALVTRTRERGHVTIDGKDVLRRQAMSQFREMTGEPMPLEVPRRILEWNEREDAAIAAAS